MGSPATILRALAALLLAAGAQAQSVHATSVVGSDTRGNAGGGVFQPLNALGAPLGGGTFMGSLAVHSLGIGGSLTLSFAQPLRNGPGADFLVAENPFESSTFGATFAEFCFVEVSSNGTDFARMPARWFGPDVEPGPFAVVPMGSSENLAGQVPVLAGSAQAPGADPQDVCEAGGDAFDLQDLVGHPEVAAGRVNLGAIAQLRLVDARSGIDRDAAGRFVRDTGSGSADIDAVTAVHHAGNATAAGPVVSLAIAPDGTFTLSVDDPDGWTDLAPASLRASLQGRLVDAGALLSSCVLTRADASGFTLAFPYPLPPELRYRLAVSVKDLAGHRSGAARSRPL